MTDHPVSAPAPRASRAAMPFRLNLDQQRKRAKELLDGLRAGDAEALRRFRRHHPRAQHIGGDGIDHLARLSEAQLVIARELGLPSWPRLKAHVLALQQSRDSIEKRAGAPDGDAPTLHIRCGSDIRDALNTAGFAGDFLEYADPLCQGPVLADEAWLTHRAAFLAQAYGDWIGRTAEQEEERLRQAEDALRSAARAYERIVLWFEHDSYDQLILARCLAQFAGTVPRRLELISVGKYPGGMRFIGLGQLPPEALRLLWQERKPVTAAQLAAGHAVWEMLRLGDPTPLARMARMGLPELPPLAFAIRRHCQELPGLQDGLSLTERLVLQILSDGPRTAAEIYNVLMMEREPLPWLSDLMMLHVLERMHRCRAPIFDGAPENWGAGWPQERLSITPLGRAVLAGEVDWLSLSPPERWLGGVRIPSAPPSWRWDERSGTTLRR